MIKKKGFKAAEIVVFFLLAALMLSGLNRVFLPKWSDEYKSGTTARSFYELPENSIDVLILGSSHVICGIDANHLYAEYGISAYSCGTEAQPILGSYVWLREALRFHELKAVVLDVADVFASSDEASYRKSFDYMRLSSVKLDGLRRYREINPEMSFGSYLFPLITYHNRWDELTAEDFDGPADLALRGFYPRGEVRGVEFGGIDLADTDERYPIGEQNLADFLAIVELCEAEGIELVLVETPSIDFDTASHNAIQAIADEHGLRFMDFNVTSQWPNIDYPNHMADFKHFNLHGAAAASDYIAAELLSKLSLPDRRGDRHLDELDAVYQAERSKTLLRSAPDALSYLQTLKDSGFALFIVSDADKYTSADGDIAAALRDLGLTLLEPSEEKRSYAAILAPPLVENAPFTAHEYLGDAGETASFAGSLNYAELDYSLFGTADSVSIVLNGVEYAPNSPGLNIVAWDIGANCLADRVSINFMLPTCPLVRSGGPDGDRSDGYRGDGVPRPEGASY